MKEKKESSYTPARKKALYEHAKKIDRIYVTVPKGKKALIEEAASALGKSVNQFINDLIDEKINGK